MSHGRVQNRANVTIREYQHVSFRPFWLLGIVSKGMEKKYRKDVCHIERSGSVSGTSNNQCLYERDAYVIGLFFQLNYFFISEFHKSLKPDPTTSLSTPASASAW